MRAPRATYRLQLGGDLDLGGAAALVPYLAGLGIADVYLSPVLAAHEGSTHGYDVVDPGRVEPALGGEGALGELGTAASEAGLGVLLDIVPNHMAASADNPWWWDVLRRGEASAFAGHFDIDWTAGGDPDLKGKVVLPVLGDDLGAVLEAGELAVERRDGETVVRYHDHAFPLAPESEALAGDLPALLDAQHWRLMFWREGRERLNYRRFFEIDDLVGVRVDDPDVFRDVHGLVAGLVADGTLTSLRVDHVDGLRDPEGYLDDLAALLAGDDRSGRRPDGPSAAVVVEKILAPGERLPASWPVLGTTGYDFLSVTADVFVSPPGFAALEETWSDLTGDHRTFSEEAHRQRRRVLVELFPAELARLVRLLGEVAGAEAGARAGVDVGEAARRSAVVEVTAALPVYRTYVRGGRASEEDRRWIAEALAGARAVGGDAAGLDLVEAVLLGGRSDGGARDEWVARWQQLTGAVTAKGVEDTTLYRHNALVSLNVVGGEPDALPPDPVAGFHSWCGERAAAWPGSLSATSTHDTKRSEDVRNRIHVLSELPEEWDALARRWTERAGATSVRALPSGRAPERADEILVCQTMLGAWPLSDGQVPEFRERLAAFLVKAAREAKRRTTWLDPDPAYEDALVAYAGALFDDGEFLDEFLPFQRRLAVGGASNSLAETVLKVAAPGVPDVYQGTELWDLSLVDPDNRRPVDFPHRREVLAGLDADVEARGPRAVAADLVEGWGDGRIKLFVLSRALRARRAVREPFERGDHLPLDVGGERAGSVVAFARRAPEGGAAAVAVVPRLTASWSAGFPTGAAWDETAVSLPAGRWVDALTGVAFAGGAVVPVAELLDPLPVALLVAEP